MNTNIEITAKPDKFVTDVEEAKALFHQDCRFVNNDRGWACYWFYDDARFVWFPLSVFLEMSAPRAVEPEPKRDAPSSQVQANDAADDGCSGACC